MVIILVILGINNYRLTSPHDLDLLTGQDWSHFAGAEITKSGIHINPLNRVITHHDMSAAQPNPPVNARGPHLQVSGNFQIGAKLSGVDNGAAIDLYGQMPIIFDEWRQERGRLRIDITNSLVKVQVWNGSSSTENDSRSFKVKLNNSASITIIHNADKFIIKADKHTLGFIPDHNILAGNSVWFGADATPGSDGWMLESLTARGLERGRVAIIKSPPLAIGLDEHDTLRSLTAARSRQIPIGAAVSAYPLFTDDTYRQIVLGQFSMITPENSLKAGTVHPQKNVYSFEEADSLIEAAAANQMQVHGHMLVSDKANPSWITSSDKKDRQQILTDHISKVVSHFRGQISEWDVINEPLSEEDIDYTNGAMGLRWDLWLEATGENYIDTALKTAHAADPSAKLFLNDYGLEKDGKRWDAMVSLIQRLQQRGTPIDGIGFEAHVYHFKDKIDPAILKAHIQFLAGMGISSRISEIDVLGDDPTFQADQFAGILKACLEEPSCTSFSTWGVTDLYGSTILSDRYPPVLGDSLIWDEKMMPKPVFTSLQNVLNSSDN